MPDEEASIGPTLSGVLDVRNRRKPGWRKPTGEWRKPGVLDVRKQGKTYFIR